LIFFFRQFIEATGYALFSVLLLHFSSLFHTKVSQKKCGQFRFFFTLLFNELKKKERKKQKKKHKLFDRRLFERNGYYVGWFYLHFCVREVNPAFPQLIEQQLKL